MLLMLLPPVTTVTAVCHVCSCVRCLSLVACTGVKPANPVLQLTSSLAVWVQHPQHQLNARACCCRGVAFHSKLGKWEANVWIGGVQVPVRSSP